MVKVEECDFVLFSTRFLRLNNVFLSQNLDLLCSFFFFFSAIKCMQVSFEHLGCSYTILMSFTLHRTFLKLPNTVIFISKLHVSKIR